MRSKKLLICLVFLFVSLFAFGFNAKVNAIETSELIKVEGAQVRTTGNAGIRFVATEAYEGENETYGILLAFGEAEADENFVVGGTVNGKVVANAEIATAEGTFAATLYDIPEVYYTQAISARAYVKAGETYVYSSTVCVKSLAEVALKAKADGEEGTLIDDVAEYVEANYKYVFETETQIVLANALKLNTRVLEIDFINDVNELLGLSLTIDSTYKQFVAALAPNNTIKTDVTAVNAYKFFSDAEMATKWAWLAEYLEVNGSTHVKNQAIEILDDGIYNSKVVDGSTLSNLYGLEHFASAIYVLLNEEAQTYTPNNYYLAMDFTDSSKYNAVNEYFSVGGYYKDCLAERIAAFVKVGKTITLPVALEKDGYTWNGWTDGTNTYEAGSEYTLTSEDVEIVPSFTAIEYTIKFIDEGFEYEEMEISYTINDEVTLPSLANFPGLTFAGWYDNEECTGEAITKIAAGTTEDIVLYAKWIEGYDEIAVNQEWATLEDGASVEFNGSQYTLGSDAHATLDSALAMIQSNGTIYLAAGTYTNSFTISLENLRIVGPNAEVAGDGTRAEEAVFEDSVITLAGSVAGTELVGLAFTGTSQIIGNAGTTGSANAIQGNHDYFLFKNNYIDSSLASGNGFMVFSEAGSGYTTNPEISYNYFTGSTLATTAFIYLDNNRNLKFNNNVFENVATNAFYVNDKTKGLSGTAVEINGNTFTNVTGYAMHFNWISNDKASTSGNTLSVSNNTFENVSSYCVFFGSSNASDVWAYTINGNTFKGTIDTGIKFNRTVATSTYTVTGNVFEAEPTTKYFANGDSTFNGTVNVTDNTYPEGYSTAKFDSCVTLN